MTGETPILDTLADLIAASIEHDSLAPREFMLATMAALIAVAVLPAGPAPWTAVVRRLQPAEGSCDGYGGGDSRPFSAQADFLRRLLGTAQLTAGQWGLAFLAAVVLLLSWEAGKWIARRTAPAKRATVPAR